MGIMRGLGEKLFGGGDAGTVDIEHLSLEELQREKANIRADVKLKRDRHSDLRYKREKLFERVVDTDDQLLKKELAEEITSIEDEMTILHSEHVQLMDSLRVVDGLIAIKRRERMAEQTGLITQIREMNRDSLVETLRRADVREMIQDERWDQLNTLLGDQLTVTDTDNQRVDEILQQADDVQQLEDEIDMDDAVQHTLRERDVSTTEHDQER